MTNYFAHLPTGTVPESAWFTSSYSGANNGNCVEVALQPEAVHVRDSKDRQGAVLSFDTDSWAAFTAFAASCDTETDVIGS
jgi:hypothetical protein